MTTVATWVLVIFMNSGYAGEMVTVGGFTSRAACEAAGHQVDDGTPSISAQVRWRCVEVR